MDNIQILAQAPVAGYVTFGDVITIFIAELTVFIAVIGIMMLWIGNQLNNAATRRDTIAKEGREGRDTIANTAREERNSIAKEGREERSTLQMQLAQNQRKLDNLLILVATEKGLSVEEALRLVNETNKD